MLSRFYFAAALWFISLVIGLILLAVPWAEVTVQFVYDPTVAQFLKVSVPTTPHTAEALIYLGSLSFPVVGSGLPALTATTPATALILWGGKLLYLVQIGLWFAFLLRARPRLPLSAGKITLLYAWFWSVVFIISLITGPVPSGPALIPQALIVNATALLPALLCLALSLLALLTAHLLLPRPASFAP